MSAEKNLSAQGNLNLKILVATHKAYQMPKDEIYLPIQVGRKGKSLDLGFTGDDSGDNISLKNPNFCELTAIYWGWKNLNTDYLGLAHYRRHFSYKKKGGKWESVLNSREARELLSKSDIILPKKRNYFIETNYSHYIHAHEKEGLLLTLDIIKKDYPAYSNALEQVMNSRRGHRFNMFIMKKELFDDYCQWLFDILFKVEEKLDISSYSPSEARVFGYLSERMLDIWLIGGGYDYKEIPVIFMESQNWLTKGTAFLRRKFFNKK